MLNRSVTPTPTTSARSRFGLPTRLTKSHSTPDIKQRMAAVASPPRYEHAIMDTRMMAMDTNLDTRTPSPVQQTGTGESSHADPDYKPDLTAEVAMLSTKLVNAINYQTNLDDSLQASRHEMEQYRQRCATLEAEKKKMDDMLTGGVLVEKHAVDISMAKLRAELVLERAAREAAEKAKKQTEGELENLTTALFEEANTMVAAARKDTEAAEKRNAQLKSQIKDTEMLLASQQEQLQDLKSTIEGLQTEAPAGLDASIPSTPITATNAIFDALHISPNASSLPDLPPDHPLHFSQLLTPVLRNDISAYHDFADLLMLARRVGAHSRQNSSQGNSLSQSVYGASSASTSSPNLPGSFSFSNNSSPSSNFGGAGTAPNVPPLKDSRFYRRVLTEDIEPTLRLDLAPGLSFLSRRTVQGSLLQGTLAVEPYGQNKHYFACTLCGESKRGEPYVRKYRFRTSEDDSVSKPLCDYCVARLRATCDFVGYLRMMRDGHIKCDSENDQKSAWEEAVRLRERMFWARLGGGVIPCLPKLQQNVPPTPSSATDVKSDGRASLERIPETQPKNLDEVAADGTANTHVFRSQDERPGSSIVNAIVNVTPEAAVPATPEVLTEKAEKTPDPVTPPMTGHLPAEDSDATDSETDAGAIVSTITTPFEDASQQLEIELEQSVAATGPAGTEKSEFEEAVEVQPVAASASAAPAVEGAGLPSVQQSEVAEESLPSAEQLQAAAKPQDSSLRHSLHAPAEASPRNSLSAERPPHERKNSSVLARVRAMENAKGK